MKKYASLTAAAIVAPLLALASTVFLCDDRPGTYTARGSVDYYNSQTGNESSYGVSTTFTLKVLASDRQACPPGRLQLRRSSDLPAALDRHQLGDRHVVRDGFDRAVLCGAATAEAVQLHVVRPGDSPGQGGHFSDVHPDPSGIAQHYIPPSRRL